MRSESQESASRASSADTDAWQSADYLLRIDPEIFGNDTEQQSPSSFDIPDLLDYFVSSCAGQQPPLPQQQQTETESEQSSSSASDAPPQTAQPQLTADEFILRELTDIRRLLLRRLLIIPDVNDADADRDDELYDILATLAPGDGIGANADDEDGRRRRISLALLAAAGTGGGGGANLRVSLGELAAIAGAATPLFPVGDWAWVDCCICADCKWLYKRVCCGEAVCGECLRRYLTTKVGDYGQVKIECPAAECRQFVHRDEISSLLDAPMKERFYQYLVRANEDPTSRTCPKCNHVRKTSPSEAIHTSTKKNPVRSRVVCTECNLIWCFTCHSPWHEGVTCKQFRKGDRLVKNWALQMQHGQLNAQKCPKCKVFIQRTTGCDHMHCTRCKTDFCYRCGDRLRKLRFFGDHYSKLSIFGCKFRYKADNPVQRKLIRGAVFGSKLMVAPIVGTLGACAGVVALGFGLFALPVYGGVRLYQKYGAKRQQVIRLQQRSRTIDQDFAIYLENDDNFDSSNASSASSV